MWSWLGAAAARTEHIALGTGVTCPTLRYHPVVIAQAAATMATLAPKRFYLGLGTGEALNEYAASGQWPDYAVRREQLIEAVQLMRALWRGEPVTHRGQFYQTRAAQLFTRPSAAIPIYISSLVPNSARLAGEIGDGLITVGGKEPDLYREIIRNFEAGARAVGKDPAKMPRMVELAVSYGADEAEAIECRKQYWAGTFVPALFTERIYTPKRSTENGKAIGADTIKHAGCFSADPTEHVRLARRYLELGFDHLIFHSAGPDQRAFIEGYGRDVLPKLRQSSSPVREPALSRSA